jgi:hypothetical protein
MDRGRHYVYQFASFEYMVYDVHIHPAFCSDALGVLSPSDCIKGELAPAPLVAPNAFAGDMNRPGEFVVPFCCRRLVLGVPRCDDALDASERSC